MKIGYVVQQFYPLAYGSGVHAFELSRELARLGHEIHIITKGEPFQKEYEVFNGIQIHRILNGIHLPYYFPLNSVLLWKFGRKFAQNSNLDIIVGHGFESSLFFKMRNSIPFVYKAAGTIGIQRLRAQINWRDIIGKIYFPFLGRIEHAAIRYSNLALAVSDSIKQELITEYSIPPKKIYRIHNGVNALRFQPSNIGPMKKDLGLTNKKVILFVGRLSPIKGPDLLLKAIPAIIKKVPSSIFLFLGDGPLRSYLEHQVQKFHIKKYVRFLGFVPNSVMPKFYTIADLCVIPSLYEPFGLVALESLASGTPILSSISGGLAEIHQHLTDFPILKPLSSENIRSNTINLLLDPERAERLGKLGRAVVFKKFTWERCAKKTMNIIKKSRKNEIN